MDAFDRTGDGLAVWDADDNLVEFNMTYNAMFERNMKMSAKKGQNFYLSYETALESEGATVTRKDFLGRLELRANARNGLTSIIGEFSLENKTTLPFGLVLVFE